MRRICTHKMLVSSRKQESFPHPLLFFFIFLIPCHSACKKKYMLYVSENRIWWSETKHKFLPLPTTNKPLRSVFAKHEPSLFMVESQLASENRFLTPGDAKEYRFGGQMALAGRAGDCLAADH